MHDMRWAQADHACRTHTAAANAYPLLMMRGNKILVVASLVALVVVACSAGPDRVTPEPGATRTVATTAAWRAVEAPSTCQCSDGSSFRFWIHRGDPKKVMFFLQGGGACFSAATCGPTNPTYTRNLDDEHGPTGKSAKGIFDLTDSRNPFRGWSIVYVPYCTGDVHIGNATHDYGNGVVIHHNGFVNASTALAATAAAFPGASQLAVVGASAGSVASPLYAGLAHDLFPKAGIKVLADSSGAYPGTPTLTAAIGSLWGTTSAIPNWPSAKGVDVASWTLPGLFVQAAKHDPDIVFARHDYASDSVQSTFTSLVGLSADNLVEMIDGNGRDIRAAGVSLHSWVGPGSDHTIVQKPGFYKESLDGVKLYSWVADLLAGNELAELHCAPDACKG